MKKKRLTFGIILTIALIAFFVPKEDSEASGFFWKEQFNTCITTVCISGSSSNFSGSIGSITGNSITGITFTSSSDCDRLAMVPGMRKDCISGSTICWGSDCLTSGDGGNSGPGTDDAMSEDSGRE